MSHTSSPSSIVQQFSFPDPSGFRSHAPEHSGLSFRTLMAVYPLSDAALNDPLRVSSWNNVPDHSPLIFGHFRTGLPSAFGCSGPHSPIPPYHMELIHHSHTAISGSVHKCALI